MNNNYFILKYIPHLIVVVFLLILLLSPILPNAGIDNISHNILHISYFKGRIIFAIIILIVYYNAIKDRPIVNKIYTSLTLYLYPILLYIMFHTENPINFIPYSISIYLFNGESEIYLVAIFDVVLVFLLICLIQNFINLQFNKK
jgi:hypothetical protein